MNRLRGVNDLVRDVVDDGTSALEKLQLRVVQKPFHILEHVPPVAEIAKGVHQIHDTAVSNTYGMIRLVTRVVHDTLKLMIDTVDQTELAGSDDGATTGE